MLNTGRIASQWHTMTRTGKSAELVASEPEPFLEVHPEDARRYWLKDRARVVSRRGAVTLKVRVTDAVRPGTVFAPFHWGALHAPAGAGGVNDLTHRETDPTSRQPGLKATAVRLEPGHDLAPVALDDGIRAVLKEELERRSLPVVELPSGAGHDAGVLAARGVETGMLFVRSLNGGISHSPDELTSDASAVGRLALGERDRLRAFPERQPAELVQVLLSLDDGCEVVASERPRLAPERAGAVWEEQLGLADATRVEQQLARRRIRRCVLRPDAEVELAERDPVRLAAPAAMDDPRLERQELPERLDRRRGGVLLQAGHEAEAGGGDLDHGSTLAPWSIHRPSSARS